MLKKQWKHPFIIVFWVFVIISLVELVNIFLGRSLVAFGLVPRSISSLPGIFLSPFIHGSLQHYLANIIPLCLLTFFMALHGLGRYLLVSIMGITIIGKMVWLMGSEGFHVGASGLIYCYFGYLAINGFTSRRLLALVLSVITIITYSGLIWGILPTLPGISWESHLFGLIGGLIIGYFIERLQPTH